MPRLIKVLLHSNLYALYITGNVIAVSCTVFTVSRIKIQFVCFVIISCGIMRATVHLFCSSLWHCVDTLHCIQNLKEKLVNI